MTDDDIVPGPVCDIEASSSILAKPARGSLSGY